MYDDTQCSNQTSITIVEHSFKRMCETSMYN